MKNRKFVGVAALLLALPASAATFTHQGVSYNSVSDTEAEVVAAEEKYSGIVTIPETVTDGTASYTVTAVGANAFSGCPALTEVSLPATIRSIGESAFKGSYAMTAVNLPDGLESIGSYAFSECEALVSASIPGTATVLGESIFEWCSALATVTIGEGIATLPYGLLKNCPVTEFNLPASLRTVGSNSISYNGETLEFPEGLEEIAEDGVSAYWIKTLVLPSTLKNIGGYAFYYSEDLRNVTCRAAVPPATKSSFMPRPVKTKGVLYVPAESKEAYGAAEGWNGFTTILAEGEQPEVELNVRIDGLWYRLDPESKTATVIAPQTQGESYAGDVAVPAGVSHENAEYAVTALGDNAFVGASLTKITLPEGLVSIGKSTFSNSGSLRKIVVPASVTALGEEAFSYCNELYEVTFAEGSAIDAIPAGLFKNSEKIYEMPALTSLKSIGASAFYGTGLTEFRCPATVETIGAEAFKNCRSLSTIDLGSTVTSLGEGAFQFTIVTSAVIPASIGAVPAECFRGCDKLKSITLEEGLSSIGDYAFSGVAVKEVHMPVSMRTISEGAFQLCNSLETLEFSDGIESLGMRSFYYCDALKAVSFPESVTQLGDEAFANCLSLTEVESLAMTPPAASVSTFSADTYRAATLKVNEDAAEAYRAASPWNQFSSMVSGIDSIGSDMPTAERIHRIDGSAVSEINGTGIYIVTYSDGSTRKIIVK